MFGIVGWRDPLSEVVKGTSRIEKAVDDLAGKFPQNAKSPSSAAHQLIPLRILLGDMQHDLRSLRGESKARRVVSPIDTAALSHSFESIKTELRWLSSKQGLGDAFPSRHPLFKRIVEEVGRLQSELNRLAAKANWTNELVDREKDHLYEIPRRLMAAIGVLDKKAAKKVTLEELEQWISYFPPVDWEDPQTAPRVANVYLLRLIRFQVWEVRYRSKAPGRPLVLLTATSDFPDSELLTMCETTCGYQEEYQFAARYPSWRLVWRTSWYGFLSWV